MGGCAQWVGASSVQRRASLPAAPAVAAAVIGAAVLLLLLRLRRLLRCRRGCAALAGVCRCRRAIPCCAAHPRTGGHRRPGRGGAVRAHQPRSHCDGVRRRLDLASGCAHVRMVAAAGLGRTRPTSPLARTLGGGAPTPAADPPTHCLPCLPPPRTAGVTALRPACRRTPAASRPWMREGSWWPQRGTSTAWGVSRSTPMPRCAPGLLGGPRRASRLPLRAVFGGPGRCLLHPPCAVMAHAAPCILSPPTLHMRAQVPQVFDVRMTPRMLSSVPFAAGPSVLRFHPRYTSTLLLASAGGAFTLADAQGMSGAWRADGEGGRGGALGTVVGHASCEPTYPPPTCPLSSVPANRRPPIPGRDRGGHAAGRGAVAQRRMPRLWRQRRVRAPVGHQPRSSGQPDAPGGRAGSAGANRRLGWPGVGGGWVAWFVLDLLPQAGCLVSPPDRCWLLRSPCWLTLPPCPPPRRTALHCRRCCCRSRPRRW